MRAGVLGVSDDIDLETVRRALPPGHRILAETHRIGGYTDFIIEGPHMPEVKGRVPFERVALNFASDVDNFGEVCKAIAWWDHLPGVTWTVALPPSGLCNGNAWKFRCPSA